MHFLRLYSEMYEKPVDSIGPEALAVLQRYHWPGNVRELENVIQRAIVYAGERAIRTVDLPPSFQAENVVEIDSAVSACSFERQIQEFKLKLAATAIRENKGNKTLAARSLGISRAYLHRLIRHAGPEARIDDDDQVVYSTERVHA
jgi:DNA-binding NtrC family response regulator